MTQTTTESLYDWHVSSVLEGMGQNPRAFVHYVQRYTRPDDSRRYTGEVSTRTWADADAAQQAATAANQGQCDFGFRGTYL